MKKRNKILEIYLFVFYIYAFWICFIPDIEYLYLYIIPIVNNIAFIFFCKKYSLHSKTFEKKKIKEKILEWYFGIYHLLIVFNTCFSVNDILNYYGVNNRYVPYIIYLVILMSYIKLMQILGEYFEDQK